MPGQRSTPTLIFVHGFGCDGGDWDAQVRALSSSYDVIAVDLPGHGGSPLPATFTVSALAEHVVETARAIPGRIVLIGHSLGCRVILEAAQPLRSRLAGMAMLDQNLVTGSDVAAALAALEQTLSGMDPRDFLAAGFAGMFTPASDPALRARVLGRVRKLDPAFARELLLDSLRWEGRTAELLSRLAVPVLMLQSTCLDERFQWHSMKEGMTTPWTRLVTATTREARLHIVPGAGHFVMIEAPEMVNAQLAQFVRSLAARVGR